VNVLAKAAALSAAWVRKTGLNPPTRLAVLYPLAQADLETADGDAWGGDKGPHDWGATDYRPPNAAELSAIKAGTLLTGAWLHKDGSSSAERRQGDVAQLHTDSHPGGMTYAMWFAAFDDDTGGATYYLTIVLRMVGGLLSDPLATVVTYCTDLYLHGYYEGTHPTAAEKAKGMAPARPVGHRALPLTEAEQANVDAYVAGMDRCAASQAGALAGWTVPGEIPGDDPLAQTVGVMAIPDVLACHAPGWEQDAAPGIPIPTSAVRDTQPPTTR
jgi:hypothetical protein